MMSSLFPTAAKPSLFGASQPAQPQPSTGLFGNTPQQPQQSSSSLFGGATQQQSLPQSSSGLFGSSTQTPQNTSSSLFGNATQQQQPQQTSSGLFGGATQQQPQQTSSSLFGSATQQQQPQQTSSLFGSTLQPTQQPAQQQQSGLFGGGLGQSTQAQSSFGGSTLVNQPQQSQLATSSASRPLWQPGSTLTPREKSIPEQMQLVAEKWSPESQNCAFQYYFYNSVRSETIPYYGPEPGDDERKWEEALAKKPDDSSIPVLARGFYALGNRLRIQVSSVQSLQARLHEIADSLKGLMEKHDLEISVRAASAKRRHLALSQRTLQLATKVQILRNRGYALDAAEEDLKQKLGDLERRAFDPMLNGRREEIWARMVGISQRLRHLQGEAERTGQSMADTHANGIDDQVVAKANKILNDYEMEISHLAKETEEIRKDLQEWEGRAAAPTNGRS